MLHILLSCLLRVTTSWAVFPRFCLSLTLAVLKSSGQLLVMSHILDFYKLFPRDWIQAKYFWQKCPIGDLYFSSYHIMRSLILVCSIIGNTTFNHLIKVMTPDFFSFLSIYLSIYLLIYFWLCWVFIAARGLSLVAASWGYSSLRCVGFSLRWLLLLRSTGSMRAGSSCGSQAVECRLSSCGSRALERRFSSCGARA